MMRYFRRLPPLLRALWLLRLLFPLASLGLLAWTLVVFREQEISTARAEAVGLALVMLAVACNWPVTVYSVRFERPARALPWLSTWRGQLAAALGLAALPLGVVAVVLFIPTNSPLYSVEYLLTMLALLVFLAAYVRALVRFVA